MSVSLDFFDRALICCELRWHTGEVPSKEIMLQWLDYTARETPRLLHNISPLIVKLNAMTEEEFREKLNSI